MNALKSFMLLCGLIVFSHFSIAQENKYVLSDDEIIAYLNEINHHEINEAKLALKKDISLSVKNYANMMIRDHKQSLTETEILVKIDKIQPVETAKVKQFKKEGAKELESISHLDEQPFQKAYIDNMINGHKKALSFLEEAINDAQHVSLKDFLKKMHKTVKMHLEHAEKLQA